jgi:hypothetical protein
MVVVAAMLVVGGENASIRGSSRHGMGNLSKWSVVPFLQHENRSIDNATGADGLDCWSKGVLCVCFGLMGLMVGPKVCCVFVTMMVVLYIGILWVQ